MKYEVGQIRGGDQRTMVMEHMDVQTHSHT